MRCGLGERGSGQRLVARRHTWDPHASIGRVHWYAPHTPARSQLRWGCGFGLTVLLWRGRGLSLRWESNFGAIRAANGGYLHRLREGDTSCRCAPPTHKWERRRRAWRRSPVLEQTTVSLFETNRKTQALRDAAGVEPLCNETLHAWIKRPMIPHEYSVRYDCTTNEHEYVHCSRRPGIGTVELYL